MSSEALYDPDKDPRVAEIKATMENIKLRALLKEARAANYTSGHLAWAVGSELEHDIKAELR